MVLQPRRRRLPLIAFILIAIVCLVLLGFVCACMSDHPMQALERALAVATAHPALVEVWGLLVLSLVTGSWVLAASAPQRARAPSITSLQRFLL